VYFCWEIDSLGGLVIYMTILFSSLHLFDTLLDLVYADEGGRIHLQYEVLSFDFNLIKMTIAR
jgi:hypothetical protein